MYKKFLRVAAISATLTIGQVHAETVVNGIAPEAAATMTEKLKPLFGEEPNAINSTPIDGVYEVVFGMEMFYVSEDGRYFFSGDLIDGQTRTNLSETARTEARQAKMAAVSVDDTVEFKAKGEEKHVLTVFTDIDCPYCVKLHREVPKLNEAGVTVRYLGYPRAGIGSNSHQKLVNVWCADDQQTAMDTSKNGGQVAEKECVNPVADQFKLGREVGVNGTPALVSESGTLIPGFRPAAQLVQMLDDLKPNPTTSAN